MAEQKDKLRHEKDFLAENEIKEIHTIRFYDGFFDDQDLCETLFQYRQYLERKGITKDYQSEL